MQCTSPIHIANGTFPCGHCLNCRIAKSREWSARIIHELASWDKAVFVTLTYSDEFLPDNGSLRKSDLQKFFKRLRKSINFKIKYFACGEYGSKGRPHYHAIIFGLGRNSIDKALIKDCWRFCVWSNFDDRKAFGTVTYDSARYVSDYIFKKYNKEKAKEEYTSKGLEIPFKLSSQGLGLAYCMNEAENLKANFGFTLHGAKMALPRYYVEKLGLSLEDQNESNFNKWLHYSKRHNIALQNVADLIDGQRKQREITTERRCSLYRKGEL